jgi:hypothetical protein
MQINTNGVTEHSFKTLRRDYTTQACCAFCPNRLTTGTGLLLEHPQFGIVAAGPVCGPKWGDKGQKDVPDYTRFGFLQKDEKEERPSKKASAHQDGPRRNRDPLWVEEYLTLRYVKLPELGFKRLGHNSYLSEYFVALRAGNLTGVMIEHVKEIEKRLGGDKDPLHRTLSYAGLMLAYTYGHWIDRCLALGDKKLRPANEDRLRNMQAYLRDWRTLSGKQVETINGDLRFVLGDNAPTLEPASFDAFRPANLRYGVAKPSRDVK